MPLGANANSGRYGFKKAGLTKQARAGLIFPVSRMQSKLKQKKVAMRIGTGASIYLTAVAEHIMNHVLEAAHEHSSAKSSKGDKTRRLTINDLVQAVRTDPDTARLFADFSFSTHTSAIKPRKVQKMIMTKEDWENLQKKKEGNAPPDKSGGKKKKV